MIDKEFYGRGEEDHEINNVAVHNGISIVESKISFTTIIANALDWEFKERSESYAKNMNKISQRII